MVSRRHAHVLRLALHGLTFVVSVCTVLAATPAPGKQAAIYGNAPEGAEIRYPPAQCMGDRKAVLTGEPGFRPISMSCAERANLSMRMGLRRFSRLTNRFSEKVEQHENALALYFMF